MEVSGLGVGQKRTRIWVVREVGVYQGEAGGRGMDMIKK